MTVVVSYLPYPVVAGFLGSIGGSAKGGSGVYDSVLWNITMLGTRYRMTYDNIGM